MGQRRNKPGKSARDMADKKYLKRVGIVFLGVAGLIVCANILKSGMTKGWGIALLVFIVAIVVVIKTVVESKSKTLKKEENRAERGAKAEESVSDILESLGGERSIFHDVDTGRGDIDHIVLSRKHGLFLIETKSHHGEVTIRDGRLLIDGKEPEKDFIAQTLRNTLWLRDRIKEKTGIEIWVQPVIVFTNGFVKEWKPVRGILLRNSKYLLKAMEENEPRGDAHLRLWERIAGGGGLW